MDSNMLLWQQGHLPTRVPPPRIDAHQKHDSHIKNCVIWPGMAIEIAPALIKMD
jgi:hypothetical protein